MSVITFEDVVKIENVERQTLRKC